MFSHVYFLVSTPAGPERMSLACFVSIVRLLGPLTIREFSPRDLVHEVPNTGELHGHGIFIGGLDDFFVTD